MVNIYFLLFASFLGHDQFSHHHLLRCYHSNHQSPPHSTDSPLCSRYAAWTSVDGYRLWPPVWVQHAHTADGLSGVPDLHWCGIWMLGSGYLGSSRFRYTTSFLTLRLVECERKQVVEDRSLLTKPRCHLPYHSSLLFVVNFRPQIAIQNDLRFQPELIARAVGALNFFGVRPWSSTCKT